MPREPVKRPPRYRFWLTLAAWGVMFASTAMAAREMRRFLEGDPRFLLEESTFSISGTVQSPRERVQRVFQPDFGRSVFDVPLAERRRRLLAIDWVEDASVSRLWPNRLLVRILERKPVAFVNLGDPRRMRPSHLVLIDAHGVLLERPPGVNFPFPVLSGVGEEQSEPERAIRVRELTRLLKEMGPDAKHISVVDTASLDNLKVLARVDGRALELWMGTRNFLARYRNFINNYPEIRKHSPTTTIFDLRLDNRVTAKEGTNG